MSLAACGEAKDTQSARTSLRSRTRKLCSAGDWGGTSTGMKPWVSAKAGICVFCKVGPALQVCRFLVYGVRSLEIQVIFRYNNEEYVMSEVTRNAFQAEYNVYLQHAGF